MTTKEKIMEAAAYLFQKKGFAATTIQDLASEIGIKGASIYNHVRSKQEILEALLLDIANHFIQEMQGVQGATLSPYSKLERLIQVHIELAAQKPNSCSLINAEWVHLEKPAKSQFWDLRNQYEASFRQLVVEAIEQKELKDADPDIIVFSILSTLRWVHVWLKRNPSQNTLDLGAQLKINLLEGIKNNTKK